MNGFPRSREGLARWPVLLGFAAAAALGLSVFLDLVLPSPGPFYDIFLAGRAAARSGIRADPFLVLIEDDSEALEESPRAELAARAMRVLEGAALRGLLIETRIEGFPESRVPILVFGGACLGEAIGQAPPERPIRGLPPPGAPAARGFIGFGGGAISGQLNLLPSADGRVRGIPLAYRAGKGIVPAAALDLGLRALGLDLDDAEWRSGELLPAGAARSIPFDEAGMALVDFPLDSESHFYRYRLSSLAEARGNRAAEAAFRQELEGSLAFLVPSGKGRPRGPAPLSQLFDYSLIPPLFVEQILEGRYIREAPPLASGAFLIAFSLATAAAILSFRSPRFRPWLLPLAAGLAASLALLALFALEGIFVDPLPFLAWSAGASALCLRARRRAESRERDRESLFAELGKVEAGFVHGLQSSIAMALDLARSLDEEELGIRGRNAVGKQAALLEDIAARARSVMAVLRSRGASMPEAIDAALLAQGAYRLAIDGHPGISGTLELAGEPLPIRAVPREFAQILEILIANALESYPPEAAKKVSVSARRSGRNALIAVGDEGSGIEGCASCAGGSCMECGRIGFGRTTKIRGSGFGLQRAREIAGRNGAELSIGRAERGGSLVSLSWPLARAVFPAAQPTMEAQPLVGAQPPMEAQPQREPQPRRAEGEHA